jgi:hypothetical protein
MTAEQKAREIVDKWQQNTALYHNGKFPDLSTIDHDLLVALISKALHLAPPSEPTDDQVNEFLKPAEGCVVDWSEWDEGFKEGVRWCRALKRNGG